MKNAKPIVVLICFLFIFFTAKESFSKDSFFDRLKNMLTDEKEPSVEEIVEETQEIKDEVKDLSEDYVIKSIKKYKNLISEMRSEVNSKSWYIFERSDAEKFDIILDTIEEIKDLYVRLKKNKGKVKERMLSYIEDIRNFNDALSHKIPEEERKKKSLKRQYKDIDSDNRYSSEQKEIKKRGLKKRITFAERRIRMLHDFKNNYRKILPVMKNADKSIDRFVFVVGESADVYVDAYNTLKLQRDISNAYRTIEELKSLDYLSEDIMKSWSELESIVNVLTDQVVGFSETD